LSSANCHLPCEKYQQPVDAGSVSAMQRNIRSAAKEQVFRLIVAHNEAGVDLDAAGF
jgi:hypothetical protein